MELRGSVDGILRTLFTVLTIIDTNPLTSFSTLKWLTSNKHSYILSQVALSNCHRIGWERLPWCTWIISWIFLDGIGDVFNGSCKNKFDSSFGCTWIAYGRSLMDFSRLCRIKSRQFGRYRVPGTIKFLFMLKVLGLFFAISLKPLGSVWLWYLSLKFWQIIVNEISSSFSKD